MKKFWTEFNKILALFLFWRLWLFLVAFTALFFIPKFGAWFPYSDRVLEPTKLPSWIWGFGNFDGVHYLKIAQDGYKAMFSEAFFPLYPILIRIFNFFPQNPNLDKLIYVDPGFFYSGFMLSNTLFLFALFLFYKLVRIDFKKEVAFLSLILLLAFPTSFYFGSVYTESLFLFLTVSTFYLVRKKKYLLAGLTAAFAAATRITGLILSLVLLIELVRDLKKGFQKINKCELVKSFGGVLLSPLGTLLYMFYLLREQGDPLYFLTSQPGFGAERSARPIILLPQVIFRYIKIFLDLPMDSLKFFNAALEFTLTLIPLFFLFLFIKKMRFSYWVFTLVCLILPTLTGTFSSMPRYALGGFLLFPLISEKYSKHKGLIIFAFLLLSLILISLFTRGYWIA